MKKSAIFKILTLFLTFVIFSCCSGCFVESCIGSCMDKQEAKEKAKFLERAKAKKAEADAFIPQVDDYILELKSKTYFESKEEEAYNEGFFDYHTPNWFINYYVPMSGTGPHMSIAVYTVNENVLLCEFECNLENIVGGTFFTSNSADVFYHKIFEYDKKIFIIPDFEGSRWNNGLISTLIPPSLYMIDIQNACILYCGYFEQWYDDIFNNYRAGDFFDYYYKITKKINEGENNEEN